MYYRFCLTLVLFYPIFASEKWRDPHEIQFDIPQGSGSGPSLSNSEFMSDCKKQDEQKMKVLSYYKRSLMQLTKHLEPNREDRNTYDFNLHIDADDYNDLKRAIEDISTITQYDFKKLSRLDAVLSRVRGKGIRDQMKDVVLTWSEYIRMNLFTKEAAVLAFTLMLPIIVYCYKTSTRQTIVLIVVFVAWAVDFAITWFNKYEDLEMDHMVDMSRYQSSEPTCDLTKMWFFQRWFSSLSPTEECRRFYTAKYKNRNYQIGPYDIVIEQAGKMMKISRFVAIEASNFLSLLTTNIPWPLNWVVIIMVCLGGFYIVQLLLFLLFGYSFRLNIAHIFNFEIKNDQQARQNRENRELIQEVRHLSIRMVDAVKEIANVVTQRNHPITNHNQQENIQNQVENKISGTNNDEQPINNPISQSNVDTSTNLIQIDQIEIQSASLTSNSIREESILTGQRSGSEIVVESDQKAISKSIGQLGKEKQNSKLMEPRSDIIKDSKESKENDDREDSSSDSIEVCGDTNRSADFDDYVVVNEGNGDTVRVMK